MTRVVWEGIPKRYWPDTKKPWRVTWGFGAFVDFATKKDALAFYVRKRAAFAAEGKGWDSTVSEPFNTVEREVV